MYNSNGDPEYIFYELPMQIGFNIDAMTIRASRVSMNMKK